MSGTSYPFDLAPKDVPRIETKYRRIATPQPDPSSAEIVHALLAYEPRSMAIDQLPVVWDRAEGFQVYDRAGNSWIDFTSGIFVANAGHAHPRVVGALREMLDRPLLHNYYFPSDVRARLTRKLVEMSPRNLDCAFLLTTGSESTECAIKLARMRGGRIHPKKLGIVTLTLGFHGKTLGAQMAGGRPEAKWWIGELDPNFHQIPVPFDPHCTSERAERGREWFARSMAELESTGMDLDCIAAFMFEPYQGWSAAFLPTDYVQAMREWATDHQAVLIADEVQSGFGRTGRLFAYQHFGVDVDMVCCGKGLSSSLPISAVLGSKELIDVDPSLNSTHGGNPLCCAAALANLEVIEDEHLVEAAERLGTVMEPRLRSMQQRFNSRIAAVSGRGAVWGLLLEDPTTGALDTVMADNVTQEAMYRGLLLVRTGVGSIKLGPPLNVPVDAALEGLDALERAFETCFENH